ncbi:MAG: isocitrate/isopropylmalate family dehydrogenase, partial [Pseudomonadota bacterium]
MSRKLLILPGDGIGPEIVTEALKVISVLQIDFGLGVEIEQAMVGGAAYDAQGHPLPETTLQLARQSDAVLLGAVGGPQYESLPRELRPERGLLGLRSDMGLFSNLRPAILYPQLADSSTLKPEIVSGLDI